MEREGTDIYSEYRADLTQVGKCMQLKAVVSSTGPEEPCPACFRRFLAPTHSVRSAVFYPRKPSKTRRRQHWLKVTGLNNPTVVVQYIFFYILIS